MRCWKSVAIFFILTASAEAQVKESDFYGTWVPIDQGSKPSCFIQGEGGHFTVGKNYYEPGDGAACKEAKTWLVGKSLRVSATCEGEEYGFRATTRELTLTSATELKSPSPRGNVVERFVLCVMPTHLLQATQVGSVLKIDEEITAEAEKPGALDFDKLQTKVVKKYGYSSFKQFDEIKFIITDILMFSDQPDYLIRRHKKQNVELVTANKATLGKLLEDRSPP